MANFESKVMNVQQRLGRLLTAHELRLLHLWDADTPAETHDFRGAAEQQDGDEPPEEPQDGSPSGFARPSTGLKLVFPAALVLIAFVAWAIYVK